MFRVLLPLSLLLLLGHPAAAQSERETIGGDVYLGGSGTIDDAGSDRDLFAAGGSVTVRGAVGQDAHFAGFDVGIEADVAEDVYAAGGSVTLRSAVGEDLTAAGFSVRTEEDSRVAGNARLAGGSVVVEGPIDGALMASAGEVLIDAAIGGDVRIFAGQLSFGPDARIGGTLAYTAPEEVEIPASVIDPGQVRFTRSEEWDDVAEATREWRGRDFPEMPGAAALFGGLLVTVGFFTVLAAVALAIWPARVEAMRQEAVARPGLALLGGIIGLATLFGLVPISVMTILGIPLLPVVLLAILIAWILGYAFGVYALALRIWSGLGGAEPTVPVRLAVFAAGLLIVALLNVIPFLGWVLNFTLVLYGIGALTVPLYRRLFVGRPAGAV